MSNYQTILATYQKAFAALSNPHRLALFRRLTTCCTPGTSCDVDAIVSVCVGDLSGDLGIAQSTVSHHLRTLRDAGLVKTARRGRKVECWVDPSVLLDLAAFFLEPLKDIDASPTSAEHSAAR